MYVTESCPCCGSRNSDAWPAVVAPFVAARALGGAPSRTRFCECADCGLRFFDARLDDSEVARLYEGYRGDGYLRERRRHEWWYTRRLNDRLGRAESEIRARRQGLAKFLSESLDLALVGSVLDFGGDRGQFIPEGLGRFRAVFDPSGVEPLPGIEAITHEAALEGRTFDLVLVAHVLEHASEPAAMLSRLTRLSRPGSWLYVEVPLERPRLLGPTRGLIGEHWIDLLLRVRPLFRAVEFGSTTLRVALGVVPPLGLLEAHEHLNFFHAVSLARLADRVGWQVVSLCEEPPVVRMLARSPTTPEI